MTEQEKIAVANAEKAFKRNREELQIALAKSNRTYKGLREDAFKASQKTLFSEEITDDTLISTFNVHKCIYNYSGREFDVRKFTDHDWSVFRSGALPVASMMNWEFNKSVYLIDSDVGVALIESEDIDKIPPLTVLNLPERSFYIAFPDKVKDRYRKKYVSCEVCGVFVYLETFNNAVNTPYLSLYIHEEHKGAAYGISFPLFEGRSFNDILAESELVPKYGISLVKDIFKFLLYLCTTEPDVIDQSLPDGSSRGRVYQKGNKIKLFAAKSPKIKQVGYNVGKAIRHYTEDCTNRGVAPHIRKGHWHSFWYGKKGQQEKRLRWLLPMIVGAKE